MLASIDERIGKSISHGDTIWEHIDPLCAMGLVGITERAVDAVYRFRQGLDSHAHESALTAILSISRALDARQNWRYKKHEALASSVLEYWTVPHCFTCCGRRAQVVDGTPMLGEACPDCSGTGQRDYPWGRQGREARYHTETLYALQEAERRIRNKLLDRLARELNV